MTDQSQTPAPRGHRFNPASPLFPLGRTVCTRGVDEHIKSHKIQTSELLALIGRHISGDGGDLCEDDAQMNADAVEHGNRIMSVYTSALAGKTVWIITEADRTVTTLLFPEEY